MAKRLTNTKIWDKVWFHKLSPKMKCFVRFLDDHCDHAGVWHVNFDLAEFRIGESIQDEIEKLPEGFYYSFDNDEKWFLPKFIEIQNGDIFKEVPEGKKESPIISRVKKQLKGYRYSNNTLYDFYYSLSNHTLSIGFKEEEYKEEEKEDEEDTFGKSENLLSDHDQLAGILIQDKESPDKLWQDDLFRKGLQDLFNLEEETLKEHWQEFWKYKRAGASIVDREPANRIREHFRNWLNKRLENGNGEPPQIDHSKI